MENWLLILRAETRWKVCTRDEKSERATPLPVSVASGDIKTYLPETTSMLTTPRSSSYRLLLLPAARHDRRTIFAAERKLSPEKFSRRHRRYREPMNRDFTDSVLTGSCRCRGNLGRLPTFRPFRSGWLRSQNFITKEESDRGTFLIFLSSQRLETARGRERPCVLERS